MRVTIPDWHFELKKLIQNLTINRSTVLKIILFIHLFLKNKKQNIYNENDKNFGCWFLHTKQKKIDETYSYLCMFFLSSVEVIDKGSKPFNYIINRNIP